MTQSCQAFYADSEWAASKWGEFQEVTHSNIVQLRLNIRKMARIILEKLQNMDDVSPELQME